MSKLDILEPGLKVMFIGFNPSWASFNTGFNYAGQSNRFYRILFEAGLTDKLYKPGEGPELLRVYRYGFTNIVTRPTHRADELTAEDYAEGRVLLRAKLEQFKPRVACYVGKGVYEQFAKPRRKVNWSFQAENVVSEVRDFVGPSSSGLVRMKLAEQVDIYRHLSAVVRGSGLPEPDGPK